MDRLRILILGGYGTFGGRLAQLLADDTRLELLIAGRSRSAAEKFCAALPPGAARSAVVFDRDGDAAAQLRQCQPDLVIDSTGPFQHYGAQSYRLIEACIATRLPYLDLADGADFVAGVDAFDDRAKQAGIFVISGVSSFPALTAAVVRALSKGMTRLDSVAAGIAPSPYAGVGLNVIRAITSYAGKPIQHLKDGQLRTGYPLIDSMRFTIAPPGTLPLHSTRFSLVDVPDLKALPLLWPELKSVFVGAGPVPAVLHRGLSLLAWLVRLRLLPSLVPLSPLFHRVINTLRWGEHRGGMFVELAGQDAGGSPLRRSWHLLAEGSDGPLIPSMAAAALVRRMLDGRSPAPGARSAVTELELADYEFFFVGRQIVTGQREDRDLPVQPLYRRVLQSGFDALSPAVRAMHDATTSRRVAGTASVERGKGLLANVLARLMRFPKTARQIPVEVTFTVTPGREVWLRNFGGERFHSVQTVGGGRSDRLLIERFGPVSVALAAVVENRQLKLIVRRWSVLGIPMPRWLAPGGHGIASEIDGRFNFDVEIAVPLLGPLVRYRGWLAPTA